MAIPPNPLRVVLWGLLVLGLTAPTALSAERLSPEDQTFFEARVRPILVDRCFSCHSAQGGKIRGGLRLDSRPGWQAGGNSGPVIEPGLPDDSLLIQAVRYENDLVKMPPKTKGKLPESEIATLSEWVRRGAPDPRSEPPQTATAPAPDPDADPEQWAFQPLAVAPPPSVSEESWCRTPVDRFILAKLEQEGIKPSPEADRRTLIRRVYFDLIGLPPTPEELNRLLNEPEPYWFDRLVDDLLDRPQYGERWARHWLDLARFAESHGFEHDYDRPYAYHYRDFVIEALNSDLPYDQFIKWQLAGDEFRPNDPLALKATGFLAAGTHSTQITKNQAEKERYDELDDMVATTGTAFLGLTIGCARCHDHKYDPIPTKDYYRLASIFTTTVRSVLPLPTDPETYQKSLKRFGAEHAPYVEALKRFEAEQLPGHLALWEQERDSRSSRPRWVTLDPSKLKSSGGSTFRKLDDGSYLVEGKNPDFDTYTITASCDLAEITAIKVEALSDPSLPHAGPGRASNGNFALSNLSLKVGPRYGISRSVEPKLINPKATFEQKGLSVAFSVDADPKSAWAVDPQFGKDHASVFELGFDVLTDSGATLTFTLEFRNNAHHGLGRFRLSATDAPRPVGLDGDAIPAPALAVLDLPESERSDEQKAVLLDWYRTIDPQWRALNQALLEHEKTRPKDEGPKALICSEGVPAVRLHTQGPDFLPKTHYLRRGDPNQKAGVAEPGFLQVLTHSEEGAEHWLEPPPDGWRTSYRRRALADWITDTQLGAGQLAARVIVNRLWQHHLGRGIVATPSDFGLQGTPPTHPELLDWLALELIHNGWHLKDIHRLIVKSATYRQSSSVDPEKAARDIENRLFWRQQRRRLEAEPIRDSMLFVAGLLDDRLYGPGTLDPRMRRRSLYFTVKRSRLIPFLTLFDAPDALTPIAVRSSTTVAPQSLLVLNNPIVREWASAFSTRVRPDEGRSTDEGIHLAYLLALSRPPDHAELAQARLFLDRQTALHDADGSGHASEAAWTDFCQVLFGLNEFIFMD
jgi:hypothetical protein